MIYTSVGTKTDVLVFSPTQQSAADFLPPQVLVFNSAGTGGGFAGSIDYSDIINKPTEFPPSSHTHTPNEVGADPAGTAAALIEDLAASVNMIVDSLGDAALKDVGTTPNTVAAGDDSRIVNSVQNSRSINTGTGLSGGGDLSQDRTISLENTAVVPGDYTIVSLTVDAQGRITSASNGNVDISRIIGVPPRHLIGRHSDSSGSAETVGLDGGLEFHGANIRVKFGSASGTAVEGNDPRLSDSRVPTGAAGGDLGGSYPNPDVTRTRGILENGGTTLPIGNVQDGQYLRRVGNNVVGATAPVPSPAGTSGQLQFNNAGAFGGMSGTTWNDTNRTLTITGPTLTTSAPLLDLSQTWNGAGVAFIGVRINVINSNSSTSAKPLQVTSSLVEQFSASAIGDVSARRGFGGINSLSYMGGGVEGLRSGFSTRASSANINLSTGSNVGWYSDTDALVAGSLSTALFQDAAATLAQRNGTNAQTFRVYNTWTNASNGEWIQLGHPSAGWMGLSAQANGTGAANISLALTPRGTGAISAQVPDSTTAGGNARGARAVDWQMERGTATRVASGANATIGGGSGNTASGATSTVAGGFNNSATGNGAFVGGGDGNTAGTFSAVVCGGGNNIAGQTAFVGGGAFNNASGAESWIPGGRQATTRGISYAYAWAANFRAAQGDAQRFGLPVRATTTTATPTVLTAGGSGAGGTPSSTNVLVLPNSSSWSGLVQVTARSTGGDTATWLINVLGKRGANAAATSVVNATTIVSHIEAGLSGAAVSIVADTTIGALTCQVTGVAATEIDWWAEFFGGQVVR